MNADKARWTPMKIKICWIIPTLEEGGAEKQLCMLAKSIDRERFEPSVIVLTRSGPREAELSKANIPIYEISKRWKVDPLAFRRLVKKLRELSPSIVHTWLFAANAYGRLAAKLAKVPVILGGERCVDPWKTEVHGWIDGWLAKRTTGIVCNSQGIVDFYSQRGIAASKFHVIRNGISSPSKTYLSRQEVAERIKADPNRLWIGSVGRLWQQKGHKEMIWAGEMIRVLTENSTLFLIGDGPERQRLEAYCDQVRAAQGVRFLGHRGDIAELLPHFDLYWNASHYEGQSNSILEAMLAGVPVIASDIPGNRDLIEHDRTGLLFPVGDYGTLMKLTSYLINDIPRRQRLAQAAKEFVIENFSLQAMVQAHQQLYLSLLGKD
jgi:glycosyltransferase involved in cell wall biosynthesis